MEDCTAATTLRILSDSGSPVQISVYASYYLFWEELSWSGEAGTGPDGPGVCFDYRRAGRPDECPPFQATATPQEAIEVLRAEAKRLLLLYGTPIGGYQIVVPDGDGRKLKKAEARDRRADGVLLAIARLADSLPEALETPLRGWLVRTWGRRATRERTY